MNTLFDRLMRGDEKLSLIGLGYVGLPIAVGFSRKLNVVGFDVSANKIDLYRKGIDPTGEVGDAAVASSGVDFTDNPERLRECRFHIVAVPTPIKSDHTPDLGPLESASRILAQNLVQGSIVVYESTVYPGLTEEVCLPILESVSGMTCGVDFKIGYSPERINPGDKVHRLENIVKIVSAMDEDSLDCVARIYSLVVTAGVYKAESIRVAEAAKVIENSQRDINIAFMNELSIIFHKLGIDTQAVLKAARTKWNFLNFSPGLVGGHCIGVDPYYLTHKAEQTGYHSQVILAGRRINDDMGRYVAENAVKSMIRAGIAVCSAKVAVLGLAFKENCPDIRNTRVVDILDELREYGIDPVVCDPVADAQEAWKEYSVKLHPIQDICDADAVIVAVAHDEFKRMDEHHIRKLYSERAQKKIILDVKGIFSRDELESKSYVYWRL